MQSENPERTQMNARMAAKVIAGALLGGEAMFLAIVAFLHYRTEEFSFGVEDTEVIGLVALAIGFGTLLGGVLVRKLLRVRFEASEGTQRDKAYVASVLVPFAIWEGGCLFNVVAWMLDEAAYGNLACAGMLIIAGLLFFPKHVDYAG